MWRTASQQALGCRVTQGQVGWGWQAWVEAAQPQVETLLSMWSILRVKMEGENIQREAQSRNGDLGWWLEGFYQSSPQEKRDLSGTKGWGSLSPCCQLSHNTHLPCIPLAERSIQDLPLQVPQALESFIQ